MDKGTDKELMKLDLYDIVGAKFNAKPQELKKAYRTKAREIHPDKNKNANANADFVQLKRAFLFLTDTKKRAEYDREIKAKLALVERTRVMDKHRQKLRENLFAREKAANSRQLSMEEMLNLELKRLHEEGERLVEQEIEAKKRKLMEQLGADNPEENKPCVLKVSWESSTRYSEESLTRIFSKYGNVTVVLNGKKAIVEFSRKSQADQAVTTEIGFIDAPLTVKYLDAPKSSSSHSSKKSTVNVNEESLASRKARQQAERSKLIEQMMAQDAETSS